MLPVILPSRQAADINSWPALLLLVVILPVFVAGCGATGSRPEVETPAAPTGLEATSQNGAVGLSWDAVGEGGRVGGRPPALSEEEIPQVQAMMKDEEVSTSDICERFDISRATLYRYVGPDGKRRR